MKQTHDSLFGKASEPAPKKTLPLEKRFDRIAFAMFVIPGVSIFGLLVLVFLLRLLFWAAGISWPLGSFEGFQ